MARKKVTAGPEMQNPPTLHVIHLSDGQASIARIAGQKAARFPKHMNWAEQAARDFACPMRGKRRAAKSWRAGNRPKNARVVHR